MKARNVFALLGLTFTMGAGVFAGVVSKKAEAVAADEPTTIYCKVDKSWWTTADAAVGAYCWNSEDESQKNAEWPGVRMTAVGGQTGLWTYDVPSTYDKVIFTRVNGSGVIADWGAKTVDLVIPPVKNCFTITSNDPVWGDPGAVGEWSVYPAVSPEYHLLGTFNKWKDLDDKYILTVDSEDSNHYTLANVALEEDDEVKVCDVKNDDWYGDHGANVVAPENGNYLVDFYVHADNEVNVVLTKNVLYSVHCVFDDFNFVLDDNDKPEGVVHQYRADVDGAYRARELIFYKDGVKITSKIGVDYEDDQPKPGNNIVGDVTNGFKIYHSIYSGYMHVYLKTYSDGGISLWGTGYEENVFYTFVRSNDKGSGQSYNLNLDTGFEPDGTYIKQYKTSEPVAITALPGTGEMTSNTLDCAGLSESMHIENVANNNAIEAYQSTAWAVHNDCTEVIYLKMKADLSLYMFVGGYVESHVLTIGGNEVPLTKYSETEYRATGVSLSAGDEVTSYKIEGVEKNPTSKLVGNNNLLNNEVLVDIASADIYYNVENNNLYVSGLPIGGYHIYKNGNSIIQMTKTDPFGDYTQYKTESTSFAVGDYFRFIDCNGAEGVSGPVVFSITKINEGGLGANFEVTGSVGSEIIRCKTACSTSVYMKLLEGNDEIYFGNVSEPVEKAMEYAEGFKSALSTACSAEEGKQAAVEEAWALQATAYKTIGTAETREAIQAVLKEGSYSSVAEIREFAERYCFFIEEQSGWNLENFLGWDFSPASIHVRDVANSVDNTALIAIISVIAVTSISSIAVLLVIKKRKHN